MALLVVAVLNVVVNVVVCLLFLITLYLVVVNKCLFEAPEGYC